VRRCRPPAHRLPELCARPAGSSARSHIRCRGLGRGAGRHRPGPVFGCAAAVRRRSRWGRAYVRLQGVAPRSLHNGQVAEELWPTGAHHDGTPPLSLPESVSSSKIGRDPERVGRHAAMLLVTEQPLLGSIGLEVVTSSCGRLSAGLCPPSISSGVISGPPDRGRPRSRVQPRRWRGSPCAGSHRGCWRPSR
jgi:hypothetical protein